MFATPLVYRHTCTPKQLARKTGVDSSTPTGTNRQRAMEKTQRAEQEAVQRVAAEVQLAQLRARTRKLGIDEDSL